MNRERRKSLRGLRNGLTPECPPMTSAQEVKVQRVLLMLRESHHPAVGVGGIGYLRKFVRHSGVPLELTWEKRTSSSSTRRKVDGSFQVKNQRMWMMLRRHLLTMTCSIAMKRITLAMRTMLRLGLLAADLSALFLRILTCQMRRRGKHQRLWDPVCTLTPRDQGIKALTINRRRMQELVQFPVMTQHQ